MRTASSDEAIPCGVDPETKLFGAAATRSGNRACDAGESKLQLSKSIPAASAAAASSGDLTCRCVRQRLPLSCRRSQTEYFLSGLSMAGQCGLRVCAARRKGQTLLSARDFVEIGRTSYTSP